MKFLAAALLSVALIACGDDDAPDNKPAPVRTEDPCIAVRAEYFRRERIAEEWSSVWGASGSRSPTPFTSSSAALDRYKLDHPTCFF